MGGLFLVLYSSLYTLNPVEAPPISNMTETDSDRTVLVVTAALQPLYTATAVRRTSRSRRASHCSWTASRHEGALAPKASPSRRQSSQSRASVRRNL
jgi:hypothetical protein